MQTRKISLADKYTESEGTIYLSGLQALVRLTLLQRERDVAAGLNTAGFVSGYRGSPLGGLDQQFWRARRHLDEHHVRFQPGVNEDLAATAVWGTQQLGLFPGSRYDGVFAMWYGKGPGVDRSGDVLRHANAAGTSPHGGVLAIAGDDHAARSSTLPHQTEHDFIASMIPVLHPAGIGELLDYGIIGWAMSRFSGCWVAIKTTSELMDSSATVGAGAGRLPIALPKDFEIPPGGLGIRWPDVPLEQELRLQRHKVYAALAFAAANHVDRIIMDSPRPRFGIITTGKSYLDVRQALDDLGIDDHLAARIGLRLYKVGMPWPLEEDGVRAFARGLEEVLVVEEKRPIIENQLEAQLFNWDAPVRPRVVGKFDEVGNWLLPAAGELGASQIAKVIAGRIRPFHTSERIEERLRLLARTRSPQVDGPLSGERVPYFCSGCPHNTSTRVPDGSRAMAGIGCHYMALWMDRETTTFAHMGGEGVHWIGQAPFTDTKHVFQNLGDGTYFHSGILAIRAALAAGVNITYKILYNDVVAMTGGQPVDGQLSVAQITRELHGEGVRRLAVVSVTGRSEEGADYAAGVTFHDRRDLDRLQLELRDTPGVSVLIYNQMCATELRRRRKRGRAPEADRRVYINESVCEGCGDCGTVSNCLSIVPVETEFGRKRAINQDSCNQDYSCVEGFCPSFVTVQWGGRAKSPAPEPDMSTVPAPIVPEPDGVWSVVLAGVGGSGTVTLSAVLGMAAHLDGRSATTLDQTGLAQKFGAVTSYVRISAATDRICAPRVPAGDANLLIASDSLVGTRAETLGKLAYGTSHAVVNADGEMPAAFIHHRDYHAPDAESRAAIEEVVADSGAFFFPAGRLAKALVGDRIAATFLLLGYAWQRGLVPVREDALRAAIELNGVAVEQNWRAFRWGRLAAHDLRLAGQVAGGSPAPAVSQVLQNVVARRAGFLEAYQNQRYADRYRALVSLVEQVERQRCGGTVTPLADAVARNYFKLLAYKDEYEVARLYSATDFMRRVREEAGPGARLWVHLAPPMLARVDPASGRPRKRAFGSWVLVLFWMLQHLRFLRGSPFDPFGYTRERRRERALILEYEHTIADLLARLDPANRAVGVKIANLPDGIRGFGHVKARAIEAAAHESKALLAQFDRARQKAPGSAGGTRESMSAPM